MTHHKPKFRSQFIECVEPREIWYRYVDTRQGYFDEDGDYAGSYRSAIALEKYEVVKRTRKGVWLGMPPIFRWSKQHFVLNSSRKKYAYPTKAEAWESFTIRKQRQYWILVHQRRDVASVLRLIKEGQPQ